MLKFAIFNDELASKLHQIIQTLTFFGKYILTKCTFFFRIPPDTYIAFALTEVLNDPKHFPNPTEFKPERFLETDPDSGELVFKASPALIPFGIGKRECLGKNLAKMELFLFLSALLHQFDFEPTPKGIPDINDCRIGITRLPMPFTAKITSR